MDFVSSFITAIVNGGIQPKKTTDIAPSDRWKRIASTADRPGLRSISYWLRIEYDFAYGYAKDFKTGIEVRFSSRNKDQSLTRSDLERIKRLQKAREAALDAEIAAGHAKVAARAKTLWNLSIPSGSHPYLKTKNITLGTSARILGDLIIIPIINQDDEMVSWQTIRPDGRKKFPFGGQKKGCWHKLGNIDPTKPIYICEGWATGRSISEALLTTNVIVAFDAGNLVTVVKLIRKIYTNTQIIICADNDQSQTGQKAAASASKGVNNCLIKMPPNAGNDFNDLNHDQIRSILCPPANAPSGVIISDKNVQTAGSDWRDKRIMDHKGNLVGTSLKNAILYLQHEESLSGVFAQDLFRNDMVTLKCPPWIDESSFKVSTTTDLTITQCCAYLEDFGLTLTRDKCDAAMRVAADAVKFHSARDYFNGLKWDKKPRLDTWLKDHFGCIEESSYLAWVGKKWLTAAVKRVFEPGCKFDHVLVMESSLQGVSKSSALKTLVTFGEDVTETYHTDAVSISNIGDQYSSLKMQGVMIVELAELKGFSKQDDEAIKNWITQTIDEVKLPYDRRITKNKRQFVFAATTNQYGYLKDPTGNRRFWPVTIGKIIDLDYLAEERSQLWAEAVEMYKSGLYIGPTLEENEQAEHERQKRLSHDAWTDEVMKAVSILGIDEFKTSHIMDKLSLKLHEKDERAQRRITTILQMNGYENKPMWNSKTSKTERLWSLK